MPDIKQNQLSTHVNQKKRNSSSHFITPGERIQHLPCSSYMKKTKTYFSPHKESAKSREWKLYGTSSLFINT